MVPSNLSRQSAQGKVPGIFPPQSIPGFDSCSHSMDLAMVLSHLAPPIDLSLSHSHYTPCCPKEPAVFLKANWGPRLLEVLLAC